MPVTPEQAREAFEKTLAKPFNDAIAFIDAGLLAGVRTFPVASIPMDGLTPDQQYKLQRRVEEAYRKVGWAVEDIATQWEPEPTLQFSEKK